MKTDSTTEIMLIHHIGVSPPLGGKPHDCQHVMTQIFMSDQFIEERLNGRFPETIKDDSRASMYSAFGACRKISKRYQHTRKHQDTANSELLTQKLASLGVPAVLIKSWIVAYDDMRFPTRLASKPGDTSDDACETT